MVHMKSQGHRPSGSGEEVFLNICVAAILVMWPGPFEQTLIPVSYGVFIFNLNLIGPVVSEEKMFENVDGRTDDGWTDGRVTGIL